MKRIIFSTLIVMSLVGCFTQNNLVEDSNGTFETIGPTKTQISSPTFTSKATQTKHITATPYPTLSPQEAVNMTTSLLSNNGGCKYPCWWGIIPGVSSWDGVKGFFDSFVLEIIDRGMDNSSGLHTYIILAPVPTSIREDGFFDFGIVINPENEYIVDEISIRRAYENYLPSVLLEHGQPDQIWFWSNGLTIGDPGFVLILFYKETGLMFHYEGEAIVYSNVSGEAYVRVCSDDLINISPSITLWSSSETRDFSYVARFLLFMLSDLPDIRLIEEVTDTSMDEFTSKMLQPKDSTFCFQSNINLWNGID